MQRILYSHLMRCALSYKYEVSRYTSLMFPLISLEVMKITEHQLQRAKFISIAEFLYGVFCIMLISHLHHRKLRECNAMHQLG
jgi:hypothetical protein